MRPCACPDDWPENEHAEGCPHDEAVTEMRTQQDPEYLHEAHVVISTALAEVAEPGMPTEDWATWVLDALAEAGWHLLTHEDADA